MHARVVLVRVGCMSPKDMVHVLFPFEHVLITQFSNTNPLESTSGPSRTLGLFDEDSMAGNHVIPLSGAFHVVLVPVSMTVFIESYRGSHHINPSHVHRCSSTSTEYTGSSIYLWRSSLLHCVGPARACMFHILVAALQIDRTFRSPTLSSFLFSASMLPRIGQRTVYPPAREKANPVERLLLGPRRTGAMSPVLLTNAVTYPQPSPDDPTAVEDNKGDEPFHVGYFWTLVLCGSNHPSHSTKCLAGQQWF
ncbi:hypothetical protein BHM03_00020929 [Ensete ventricosum]|uniref:Uncharacterized protein n=1 Tax=Ensete ventricosum TaxID=4639 RepID=A0A445MFT8_ENSVE|nr:hypothetical protein BHM03_00020929 [Ensete ventricosum]